MVRALLVLVAVCLAAVHAFKAPSTQRARLQPLHENFYLDLPTLNDPAKVTPKLLSGEANYKGFVESYDKEALLIGGAQYKPLSRIQELKLLSATVDSGLLQALEDKGVTLSQLERLLPILDNAGVLPLAARNKGLIAGLLPLLVEPAPTLLPILTGLIKTSPATFTAAAAALVAVGGYEGVAEGNVLLAGLFVVLSAPLGILGLVVGAIGTPLPAVSTSTISASTISSSSSEPRMSSGSRPVAKKRAVASAPAPTLAKTAKTVTFSKSGGARAAPKVSATSDAGPGSQNGRRKVIRVN